MNQLQPEAHACGTGISTPSTPRIPFIHDRWQVLSTVKAVARALDLGEREITVLSAHLSVLAKGPVRSDQVLVSYAGLPTLLERANCMDERRFRRGEKRLEDAGLIRRKFSANSRRFPVRNGEGKVVDAYGIDLRPLFEKLPELAKLQSHLEAEAAFLNAMRSRISARLSEARRTIGACCGNIPDWLEDLTASARNILRRATLTQTEATALERQINEALDSQISTQQNEIADETVADNLAADPGQIVRHSESQRKEYKKKETLNILDAWEKCHHLASFHEDVPKSEKDLWDRLYRFAGYLGLSHSTRVNMVSALGSMRAMKVLNYLAERILDIKHPERYVQALLQEASMERQSQTA
ncbi:helix-turn-helix domain-containing protein [Primorskyibacter sp. 2E233]|uniref:helix-turn-helix domain-containing protein n=1 Tax=Primorskyibacter sp. 2E233 TaxID=3413431 RepID=UPI003BF16702